MACVANPFVSKLDPTTAADRSNAIQSNRVWMWPFDVDTRHPNPWQTTYVWCTCVSTGTLPRNPATRTATVRQQIPDYWIFSNYNQVEFYKRWRDANRNVDYNSAIVQRSMNRWGIRQTPHRQCNTGVHLCQCVDEFVPQPRCDWHWTADPNRNVPNWRGQ